MAVRRARDSATRRQLGLQGQVSRVRRYSTGSKAKRWTDVEIRKAVRQVAGRGRTITATQYKAARAELDPNLFPSYNTVHARCPELFSQAT